MELPAFVQKWPFIQVGYPSSYPQGSVICLMTLDFALFIQGFLFRFHGFNMSMRDKQATALLYGPFEQLYNI